MSTSTQLLTLTMLIPMIKAMSMVLITLTTLFRFSDAFSTHIVSRKQIPSTSSSAIYGAFNKRNKQGDLLKKMEEAKRRREMEEMGNDEVATESMNSKKFIDDDEMKKINDMKRFDELLNSESATINYDIDGANYKTQQQEEEEINAGGKCDCFYLELRCEVKTGQRAYIFGTVDFF